MRPLSVNKLNIVISRLYSGQTTCQISSSTCFSIGTISKLILSIALTSPSPLVVILSDSPQPMSIMQSTLLPLGRLKQQYNSQKHSNLSLTNLSFPRQHADTSGELVWRQWWRRKSPFCHKSIQQLKKLSQCLNTFSYIINIVGNRLHDIMSIFLRQLVHNTYKLSQIIHNLMRILLHCWWFKIVVHWDRFFAFNFSVFFVL